MVVEYVSKIKEILEGINIIELDDSQIRQNGIFLVFDGITQKEKNKFESVYVFSIYIASNTLSRGANSLYPQVDEVYAKFKDYLKRCDKLNIGTLSAFDMGSKLKIYRFEISFEE